MLNTPDGIVDLRSETCVMTEPLVHQGGDYPYDPSAACPGWLDFLNEFSGGDAALIRYLQRLVGLTITGNPGERVLPIMIGGGGNGKTTFALTSSTWPGLRKVSNGEALLLGNHVAAALGRTGRPSGRTLGGPT